MASTSEWIELFNKLPKSRAEVVTNRNSNHHSLVIKYDFSPYGIRYFTFNEERSIRKLYNVIRGMCEITHRFSIIATYFLPEEIDKARYCANFILNNYDHEEFVNWLNHYEPMPRLNPKWKTQRFELVTFCKRCLINDNSFNESIYNTFLKLNNPHIKTQYDEDTHYKVGFANKLALQTGNPIEGYLLAQYEDWYRHIEHHSFDKLSRQEQEKILDNKIRKLIKTLNFESNILRW